MQSHGLEIDAFRLPMAERLTAAARRMNKSAGNAAFGAGTTVLRNDQTSVYTDFMRYVADATRRLADRDAPLFGRIIQPPRTGKTVIASRLIEGTGLQTLFLVPSRMLVEQARAEFRCRIPNIPIGVFYGDEKNIVEHGVNVATYTSVQSLWKKRRLPEAFRRVALVFADEGHQAMTDQRQSMLKDAFDPRTLRIALTATPDYDEERTLCRFFPDLIHEITFEEAIQLDLLATYRFWLAEVDVNGSRVRVRFGDYHEEDLDRLMSEAPFFKAVETYRYLGRNRDMSTLICCATRRQAVELHAYLKRFRPKGSSRPQLVLGNTPRDEREKILRDFEDGRTDTIINVGVLTQGWNSPRCKLLLDLSPSLSRVRAVQKFSRALTKDGDAEARIIAFVPKGLPVMPVLPLELFSESMSSYIFGTRIGRSPRRGQDDETTNDLLLLQRTPIKGVELRSRYVYTTTSRAHRLDARDEEATRDVIATCREFDPTKPVAFLRFRWLLFRHDLFIGRGLDLLKHLRYRLSCHGYIDFLERYCPDGASWRLLFRNGGNEDSAYADVPCSDDVERFMATFNTPPASLEDGERFMSCFRALAGPYEQEELAEELIDSKEVAHRTHEALDTLPPFHKKIIELTFGLDGSVPKTLREVAKALKVGRGSVNNALHRGMRQLRSQQWFYLLSGVPKWKPQPWFLSPISIPGTDKTSLEHLEKRIKEYGPTRYSNLVKEANTLSLSGMWRKGRS
ncbi:MAG: DEAD/DEAH box helicase family protein [Patescibacteria group bacterium]